MYNCSFYHCTTTNGAAFYSYRTTGFNLTDCYFESNHPTTSNAFDIQDTQSISMSHCCVFNNSAVSSRGRYAFQSTISLTFDNFSLYDNTAESLSVGSMCLPRSFDFDEFDLKIDNSRCILRFDGSGKLLLHDHSFSQLFLLSPNPSSLFHFYGTSVGVINCTFDSIRSNFATTIIHFPGIDDYWNDHGEGAISVSDTILRVFEMTHFRVYCSLTIGLFRGDCSSTIPAPEDRGTCFSLIRPVVAGREAVIAYSYRLDDINFTRCTFESNAATSGCSILLMDERGRFNIETCRFRFNGRNGTGSELWAA
jgi:hypothetical protein